VKSLAVAFFSGLLFAAGLAVAGMTEPAKVVGFLDVGGDWDPSLALVMLGAIAVSAAGWLAARRRSTRPGGVALPVAPSARLDLPLLGGSAIFGVGWGLSGFCPGPALVSAFVGGRAALFFAPAMLVGMGLYRIAPRRVATTDEVGRPPASASACAG